MVYSSLTLYPSDFREVKMFTDGPHLTMVKSWSQCSQGERKQFFTKQNILTQFIFQGLNLN